MTIATPPAIEAQTLPIAYASFTRRFQAVMADAVVLLSVFAVTTILGELAADLPGSGRAFVIAVAAEALLCEPIMVWRFGGTVGHRRMNLRVVNDATGGNPSFLLSLARFFLKALLGIPSFTTMALTRRYQAVHDRLTHTTVQIRDLSRARPWDYHFERELATWQLLPSRPRRVAVILLYLVITFFAFVVAEGLLLPSRCTVEHLCGDGEEIASRVLAWLWLGGSVLCVILGWRGQLIGARARPASTASTE